MVLGEFQGLRPISICFCWGIIIVMARPEGGLSRRARLFRAALPCLALIALTGPAARFALSRRWLSPLAAQAADAAGLGDDCRNPFRSVVVRAVELVYALDEAVRIIAGYAPPPRPARRLPGGHHGL
mgnify:CR=1 FL=1